MYILFAYITRVFTFDSCPFSQAGYFFRFLYYLPNDLVILLTIIVTGHFSRLRGSARRCQGSGEGEAQARKNHVLITNKNSLF